MENFFGDFLIGLLYSIGAGVIIIIIILLTVKKKKTTPELVKKATPPEKTGEQKDSHGHDDHTKPQKETNTLSWVWSIFAFILIGFLVYYFFLSPSKLKEPISNNSSNGITTEALVLVAQSYISFSSEPWITEKIDYRFKFRSDGHAFNLQFTGDNGWLKPVAYPKEGDFYMPPNARPGPVKVTAGKEETQEFRIQLYKRIQIKN